MSWRDDLRRVTLPDGRELIGASFRGVTFFVESTDRSGGRRTVTHEFPLRDDPYVEDLGRAARSYRVDAYLLGDDYVSQRDALLAALEDESGPGELVHPYHGVLQAICTSLTVRESRTDGGMALFQLSLVETAPAPPTPSVAPDLTALVDVAALDALVAVEGSLTEEYDVAGQPSWSIASLEAELSATVASMRAELMPLAATTQEASKLAAEIDLMSAQVSSLVRAPTAMLAALQDALAAIADSAQDAPGGVLTALLTVYDAVGSTATALGATATRVQERANQAALADALRRLFVVEAAKLAPLVAYETLEDATADSSAIADRLEDQASDAGSTAYPALVLLRAQVTRAVPGDAVLGRLIDMDVPVAIPSLLLSYQLYGSVAREADVVARNRVTHPGFLAGPLQVLADG